MSERDLRRNIAVVGGGPAGLMAAERLATAGLHVTIYDRMPTLGRKLLMAGRGGLNLTHSEPLEGLLAHYGAATSWLAPIIRAFPPEAVRAWADGLGAETFVGSSGRVFPNALKASPLLRAWLARLAGLGVEIRLRHRWTGFGPDDALRFEAPEGPIEAMRRCDHSGDRWRELAAPRLGCELRGNPGPRRNSDDAAPTGEHGLRCCLVGDDPHALCRPAAQAHSRSLTAAGSSWARP